MRSPIPFLLAAFLLLSCAAGDPAPSATDPATAASYDGALRVRPDPVSLQATQLGCARSLVLDLENTSSEAAIVVASIEGATGVDVRIELPATLGPGEHRFADLEFSPEALGPWSAVIRITTSEAGGSRYLLPASADVLEPKPRDLDELEPLDLVLVLDISTSMVEMANLRGALTGLFDVIAARNLDVHFGLVTFANDVRMHGEGRPLDREQLFAELDSQLLPGSWVPDPELPRQLLNFDFPENVLGALHRAATDFAFREGSRRYVLLMTDATFLEPPAVFSDGTPARWDYDEVAEALVSQQIRLFSVNARDAGAGLSSNYEGRETLVTRTRGGAFEIAAVSGGELTLDTVLSDLVSGLTCD